MTARQVKSRLRYAEKQIEVWRTRLKLDSKWEFEVVYLSDGDPEDPDKTLILLDDSCAEYWKITVQLCPPLCNDADWERLTRKTICHELVHIILWQWSSFANNMLGAKYTEELRKLEEQAVQHLEEVFMEVKWR